MTVKSYIRDMLIQQEIEVISEVSNKLLFKGTSNILFLSKSELGISILKRKVSSIEAKNSTIKINI